jgi:uncharacterized Rossmann fold enzyme
MTRWYAISVDWIDWQPTYTQILDEFGWTEAADGAAARQLHPLVPRGAWNHVGTELKNRPRATVVGCDAALDDLKASQIPPGVVVAADGATTRLRELGVIPRVVVTDLDGDPEALLWAAEQGSSIIVHAHGDNTEQLPRVSGLGPLVAGTCQCNPEGLAPLRNYGGFTDGDRAVLLCEAFRVKAIDLMCFDTTAPTSRYSHQFESKRKSAKLAWAHKIVVAATVRGQRIRSL